MRQQSLFLLFFAGILLISCSPAPADPNAVPGLLVATIDGKQVMAACKAVESVSSDPKADTEGSQLLFSFTDSLTGEPLFSTMVYQFKNRPGKLKTTAVFSLLPDISSPARYIMDSLGRRIEREVEEELHTLEMEITRYEMIDKNNARISGRLHGKVYADYRLPGDRRLFIEIKNGVFTDIDVFRM